MKRFLLLFVFVAAPAFAQSHADVVASVKADLQARGISLADACGAFAITRRVAWNLRSEGAGTLDKPSGNQCEGRAVDIIVYGDGRAFDILTDAGGANGPSWAPIVPVDAARWRAPADPGDVSPPAGVPTPPVTSVPPPTVPVPSLDLSPILARLQQIYDQNERIYADSNNRRDAQTATIVAAVNEPGFLKKALSNPYVQSVLASLVSIAVTHQVMK